MSECKVFYKFLNRNKLAVNFNYEVSEKKKWHGVGNDIFIHVLYAYKNHRQYNTEFHYNEYYLVEKSYVIFYLLCAISIFSLMELGSHRVT